MPKLFAGVGNLTIRFHASDELYFLNVSSIDLMSNTKLVFIFYEHIYYHFSYYIQFLLLFLIIEIVLTINCLCSLIPEINIVKFLFFALMLLIGLALITLITLIFS